MKILTINVTGIPSGSASNLLDAFVFQDYEAIVVDPINLDSLYGIGRISYSNSDARILTPEHGSIISTINERRHDEIKGLLQRGGVVVCFLEPILKYIYKWRHQGKEYTSSITNYDWLIEASDMYSKLGEIKYTTGQTIDVIDSGHPFAEYLNIKPSWSTYVDKNARTNWKVLASAFNTHTLALAKREGLGHVILLPSQYSSDNGELLERCIIKLSGDKETTPQPNWAKDILVPGQSELNSNIIEVSDQIDALEKQRETFVNDNQKLERWKYLLYEKGKHQLEPMVRDALALLGCNIEPQPDKDSDGAVISDYGTALLEVVGSERTIKIEKLGQLTRNMSSFFETKRSKVKGILVGNPFCDNPLDNRPTKNTQKQLFAKELIESAEQLSITVLLSTDLYQVVHRILGGELSDTEKHALQKRIFTGKGLVRLA